MSVYGPNVGFRSNLIAKIMVLVNLIYSYKSEISVEAAASAS